MCFLSVLLMFDCCVIRSQLATSVLTVEESGLCSHWTYREGVFSLAGGVNCGALSCLFMRYYIIRPDLAIVLKKTTTT